MILDYFAGDLLEEGVGRGGCGLGLVEKFAPVTWGERGGFVAAEQVAHEAIAGILGEDVVGGYPLEGFVLGVGQATEEVHASVVDNLRIVHGVEPDVCQLGRERLDRLEVAGKDAALADVLVPKRSSEVLVRDVFCRNLLQSGQLDAEDKTAPKPPLTQALRQHPVHIEPQLGLDIVDSALHNSIKN